jgi:hypothetical protein
MSLALGEREKYQRYLCSREWGLKREEVRKRCGGVCERCHFFPMSHVHHLTYIRKYNERPEDLQGLCEGCHEFTHGKRDRDPLLDAPIVLCRQEIASVYLAGRISKPHGDWRQEIISGWRVGGCSWRSFDTGDAGMVREGAVPLPDGRRIDYSGPWWLDIWGGHGGGIGPHAFGEECDWDHGSVSGQIGDPADVARYCYECIRGANLVFAWIDSRECYGTLLETGWAKALDKVLVVATPKWDRELWLACAAADRFIMAESAGKAWEWLWTHPAMTHRLGAVRDSDPYSPWAEDETEA